MSISLAAPSVHVDSYRLIEPGQSHFKKRPALVRNWSSHAARLNFPRSKPFDPSLHGVDGHVSEDGHVIGCVFEAVSVLILVHGDIQSPMEAVFDIPMRADYFVEASSGKRRTEQVISGFAGRFVFALPDAGYLADGGKAGPVVAFLEPGDIVCDSRGSGFDAAVVTVYGRDGVTGLAREPCAARIPKR